MKTNQFLFLLIGLVTASACKDDATEPNPTADPTNLELITAHPWKLVTRWRDGVDITNDYDACYLDNTHTYTTTNRYQVTETGVMCSPPQGVFDVVFEIREDDDSMFWGTNPYPSNAYFLVTKLDDQHLQFRSDLNGILWEYAFEKK